MAVPIRKVEMRYSSQKQQRKTITPVVKPVRFNRKEKKKQHPLGGLIILIFMVVLVSSVFPYTYNNFTRQLLFGPQNQSVNVNYDDLYSPTSNYLKNDYFLGKNFLKSAEPKKPLMSSFYLAEEMQGLTARLNRLAQNYPTINPSVFVWDFETGKYVNIRANQQYPSASIIKLPVLLELFRSIELGQVGLSDRMQLTEYYRSSGSGNIQFARAGNYYTINNLAKVMIQHSDNTATNMIMSNVGGMVDVNRAIRSWGLKDTYIQNWLPDLAGTNKTSAKDIATMLYNIDNSSFLSLKSREYIVDYMSHVENNRLIQAGLPSNAIFLHKTGDIGTMLGDAGIVWAPNGKKYIVVILAKRPYNSPAGKDYIVNASSIIYNFLSQRLF